MCFTYASFKKINFTLCFWSSLFINHPCVLLMQASNKINFTLCFWSSLFINHVFYWCKLQKVDVSLDVFDKSSNFTRCFWRSLFILYVFFQQYVTKTSVTKWAPEDAGGHLEFPRPRGWRITLSRAHTASLARTHKRNESDFPVEGAAQLPPTSDYTILLLD